MTQDEVIEMAIQSTIGGDEIAVFTLPELMKFVKLVAQKAQAEERFACAKLCDEFGKNSDWPTADNCADAIRSRGQV